MEATNRYKAFVEMDLIFDSPDDFLYRQKGQLKLDNTILEEFLPQLLFRGLSLANSSFELGPHETFAGLSFASTIANTGATGIKAHIVTNRVTSRNNQKCDDILNFFNIIFSPDKVTTFITDSDN